MTLSVQGAVIRRDEDPRKQLPIADAVVTLSNGVTSTKTQSDASGYFRITFPEVVWPGQTLNLNFQNPGYQTLNMPVQAALRLSTRELYVAAMKPLAAKAEAGPNGPVTVISNIRVRYTFNTETEENIGSAVRVFQAVNQANVPCNHHAPCSPDGNWKASSGSVSLDAGPDNEFRSVRASCIAGPCPFTRIDDSGFIHGGRKITATALSWSDTATFLLEAEVFHVAMSSSVRESYPVIFGQVLNFTVPPTQEGVSLEADVNGASMVFPLGPDLYLSWATCTARKATDTNEATVYRCELKPGYKF
ncbi:MAG: carboxypeptidase-like regulatory domain-containing protein [Terracidiphilus sp.]